MSSPHDSVSETAHQTCRQRRPTLTQFAGQAGVCLHHDGFIVSLELSTAAGSASRAAVSAKSMYSNPSAQ